MNYIDDYKNNPDYDKTDLPDQMIWHQDIKKCYKCGSRNFKSFICCHCGTEWDFIII